MVEQDIFARIAAAGGGLALVSLLEIKGPFARRPDQRLLVMADGTGSGTLGDEYSDREARAAAVTALASRRSTTIRIRLDGNENASGRSGSKQCLVECIGDLLPYKTAARELAAGRRVLFVRSIPALVPVAGLPVALYGVDRTLLAGSTLPVDPQLVAQCLDAGKACLDERTGLQYDPVLPRDRLLILGAGHVGRALARAAAEIGFAVSLADDRPEQLERVAANPAIALIRSDYAAAVEGFAFDAATWVVIVTRGHYQDLECLRAALRRECRYVGCLGSQRKGRLLLHQLRHEGMAEERLAALHVPVGLDLNAGTPGEVAIAILAEMIAVRRNAASLAALKLARSGEE